MKVYYFKEWRAALVGSELSPQVRRSFEITIHWYLSYLKRARMLASISSARAFMEMALAERRPSAWAAEQWREARNWFFRHTPLNGCYFIGSGLSRDKNVHPSLRAQR